MIYDIILLQTVNIEFITHRKELGGKLALFSIFCYNTFGGSLPQKGGGL